MASFRLDPMMHSKFFFYIIIYLLIAGGQPDVRVTQYPSYLVSRTGQSVILECDPASGHLTALWYQQLKGQGPEMLFYFYNKELNDKRTNTNRFTAKQDKNFQLNISSLQQEDSALYLCASSKDRGLGISANTQVFGSGSRLIVLDDLTKVTPPKVTVFQPSEEEIEKKGKATLVCLATGFYPDLVELSWWVNGQETQVGVSTDPQPSKEQPYKNDSSYSLSSRLRVSAPFWRNPKNSFRCQVLFHGISEDEDWKGNGSKPITQNVSDQTWGKADCGVTSESYQRSVQSATFFYEILLGKAMLYGLLVSALVWRTMAKKKYS